MFTTFKVTENAVLSSKILVFFKGFVSLKESIFVVLYEYKKHARFIPRMTINNTLCRLEL